MTDRKMACCFGALGLALALNACAPSTTKPDISSKPGSSSLSPPISSGQETGEGQRSTRESDVPRSSSLDNLREGKPGVTPASSPLKDVYFEFDRYELRGDAREVLRENASWLKANPSARVEIEGHCDDRGTNEYNLALGAKRSQAAKEYLVSLGISAERLSTISYGEEIPVCKEQTEDCRAKNRRARFVLIPGRAAS